MKSTLTFEKMEQANVCHFCLEMDSNDELIIKIVNFIVSIN